MTKSQLETTISASLCRIALEIVAIICRGPYQIRC